MNLRLGFIIGMICVGILFITSCTTGSIVKEQDEVVKIGALLSLTGDAASFGEGELKAIQLAIDEENQRGGVNGKEIKLVVEDTGTLDTVTAITALRKLFYVDKVKAVIGPTWDMPGVSIVAEQENIVLVSPDNTEGVESEQNLEFFFSTWHPQGAEMDTLAEFAQRNNYNKIVIIRDDDVFSQTVADGFEKTAKDKNIEILGNYIVLVDSKDFRTELLKIREQGADAILATFASEIPRGPLLRQIKELGLDVKVLGTAVVENNDLLENYADYAEETVFYTYPRVNNAQIEFFDRYRERYKVEPVGPAAPNAYDAAKIIISALRQGAENSDEIKEILNSQEFPSVAFGELRFNDKGFVSVESTDIAIKTVRNKEFVMIDSKEPVKLGVILPLTGKGANYGEKVRVGIDLALEDIHKEGKTIELIYEDGQGDPKQTVSAFQKLINIDGVEIIIGPGLSDSVLAVTPIAEDNKVLLFTSLASSEKIKYAGDYIFRNRMSGSFLADYFARYIYNEADVKEIAVLHSNSENAATYVKSFNPAFEGIGGKIILTEVFNKGETDYRTLILKLKQRGVKDVFFAAHATEMGYFLKQAGELGFKVQMYATPGAESDDMLEIAGDTAEGVIFCSEAVDLGSDDPVIQEFRRRYKEKTGKEPDFMSANGYDALNMIVLAGDKYGFTAEGVKQGLYETKDYPGVSGSTSFDSYGEVIKPLAIKTVRNGEFVMYE